MFKHSRVSAAILVAALVVGSAAAEAAVITLYGDRTSFTAATETLTTIDFEAITPIGFLNFFNDTGGLTVDGVNFHTSGTGPFGPGFISIMSAPYAAGQSPTFNLGTGAILTWRPSNQPGTAFLDATLPAGVTAVGTDLWAVSPYTGLVNVVVTAADNTTETFVIPGLPGTTPPTPGRPPSFFGVTSDEAITALQFQIAQGQVGVILDNFSIGTAQVDGPAPVPEPSSFALLGVALAGLCRLRRSTRA